MELVPTVFALVFATNESGPVHSLNLEVAGFGIRKLVNRLAVRSPHPHLPERRHTFRLPRAAQTGLSRRPSRHPGRSRPARRRRIAARSGTGPCTRGSKTRCRSAAGRRIPIGRYSRGRSPDPFRARCLCSRAGARTGSLACCPIRDDCV